MTRSKASQCCHELLKCERKVTKGCTRGCKCVRVELPCTTLCNCSSLCDTEMSQQGPK